VSGHQPFASLAESLGFQATIDTQRNEITLRQVGNGTKLKPAREASRDPLEAFARDIVEWLRGIGKERLTSLEKKKVREMLRILLQ
jgi:F420-dependent methylenetetrahydromethanopterin dehydrogenase